jgi:hypothetical protein
MPGAYLHQDPDPSALASAQSDRVYDLRDLERPSLMGEPWERVFQQLAVRNDLLPMATQTPPDGHLDDLCCREATVSDIDDDLFVEDLLI